MPSTEGWTEMGFAHTAEPYSAVRKGERLPFATTWMELETIGLSQISQTEKPRTTRSHSRAGHKTESDRRTNENSQTQMAEWRSPEGRGWGSKG